MTADQHEELGLEELEPQNGEVLPEREEMALVQPIEDPGLITLPVEPPATE